MSKHLAATLYTSRQLSTRTRWRPFYRCSRCLSTASEPALFRQLEDGTGLSIFFAKISSMMYNLLMKSQSNQSQRMTCFDINDIAGCMYYDKALTIRFSLTSTSRYNDAKEQDVRYRPFNVTALIERALNAKRRRVDGLKCMFPFFSRLCSIFDDDANIPCRCQNTQTSRRRSQQSPSLDNE
jgi:hypothetical protein